MGPGRGQGGRGAPPRARDELRPTAARVRDALFNSLGVRIEGASVLDLFAGTGALGLDAIHRGATRAVLVERDARRAAAIGERVRQDGLERQALVRREDALAAVDRLARAGERFDVILLDPPYGQGWLSRSLAVIARAGVLAPGGVVVAEGHWRDRPDSPEGLALSREARYGETVLWFFRGGAGVQIAVYPGSFDPVHNGHVDVIRRAARLFDRVIVAVAQNVEKGSGIFTAAERVAMLREVIADVANVEVTAYSGLTVDFAQSHGAMCLIKGLRAVGDFDFELKQSAMNRKLAPDLDTLLLIAAPEFAFISSSLIREVTGLGGSVESIVPPAVVRRLRARQAAEGAR